MTLAHNVSELLKSAPGAARQVTMDEPAPRFGPDLHIVQPVRGTARFLRTQNGILARAELDTTVELECSRCLETIERDIAIDLEEEFRPSVHVTTGALLEPPEDDALRIDERHVLDLTEAARQYIETDVPLQPLCSEACRGLCPECGANLNQGACACGAEPTTGTGPFAALELLIDRDMDPQSRAG